MQLWRRVFSIKAIPTCCLFNRKQSHPHLFWVDFFYYLCMTSNGLYRGEYFSNFWYKKSEMECKNITSIFIKIIQRKKNTPPLTGKVSTLKEKKQQVYVFYAFIKIFYCIWVWFSKQKVNPRVLFQFFLVKGIPLIWPKINSTGVGGRDYY